MLTVLAHAGQAPAPHDVWGAWTLHPGVVVPLVLLLALYHRGRRRTGNATSRRRAQAFHVAWGALVVALVSPIDAMATALASAHMVQHVLLVLVAAPLLAVAAPLPSLLRGLPARVARTLVPVRRGPLGALGRGVGRPATAWLLHVGTLWGWHAAGPYDAALAVPALHAAEHATFLLTGVLVWQAVVGPHRVRASDGIGVLVVFGLTLQSVFLSVLLTFAGEAWYDGYASTTAAWGLTPLADQQLAGAIMWVPAGAIHVGVGLALLVGWIRSTEPHVERPVGPVRAP